MQHSTRPRMNTQIVNGVHYNSETPSKVIEILENARNNRYRLQIVYGDSETGKDWLEEWQTFGRVGRSTGTKPVPLLVHNSRSMGGPALLDKNIVRIRYSQQPSNWLYEHSNYHHGKITIDSTPMGSGKRVIIDGKIHATFETQTKLLAWLKKMGFNNIPEIPGLWR